MRDRQRAAMERARGLLRPRRTAVTLLRRRRLRDLAAATDRALDRDRLRPLLAFLARDAAARRRLSLLIAIAAVNTTQSITCRRASIIG